MRLRDARDSINWRSQPGKFKVDLCIVHRSFGGFYRGAGRLNLSFGCFDLGPRSLHLSLSGQIALGRIIEILLGDGLLLSEGNVAILIELRLTLIGFRAGELRLGLQELRPRLR